MIVLKNIEMTLDPKSIATALRMVEDLRSDLGKAMTELIRQLTEQGKEFARMELLMFNKPAYDTGALHDSIAGAMINDSEGVVTTGVMYAAFVEYGTGIVGETEPHPDPAYDYDIHDHGWEGWVYGANGQFHRTAGMPARPFMYRTLRDLEDFAERNGGQIIAEYIP